ncbi:uncharacterized protein J8A68_005904 [[Candida] subhashii]|uniref:SEC7 domain-containing protein n=1 Tax=[Candida] subhashii TaxID=561895 RepID=A0A8J5QFZ1_9ASCO|nr:uncharacterized protein J8A68_005904 [[Candida] subhashii]KAG7660638.1 hypothetical protein J8A68_005904 [[Candida] subhashii]
MTQQQEPKVVDSSIDSNSNSSTEISKHNKNSIEEFSNNGSSSELNTNDTSSLPEPQVESLSDELKHHTITSNGIKTPPPPPPPAAPQNPEGEYLEIAKKLFEEEFVSIQPEEYIQFLASKDPESTKIRNYYMNLFSWPTNLLSSTRMLCSKLYLKGESQEIDRILTSFTQSYLKQHPHNIFCTKNFEQIYVIIYSLILLNTALHNSELNKKSKISQADFIKNTYSTFLQQNPSLVKTLSIKQRFAMERELSNFYEDLAKTELHLKTNDESQVTNNNNIVRRMSKKEQHPQLRPSSHPPKSAVPPNPVLSLNNAIPTTTTTTITPPEESQQQQPQEDQQQLELSRELSSSNSIWSSDTTDHQTRQHQTTLFKTATNSSSYTSSSTNGSPKKPDHQRVGLARVLASDGHRRIHPKSSTASLFSSNHTVTARASFDNLRNNGNGSSGNAKHRLQQLNHHGSRMSLMSRESNFSQFDDMMSELTFESMSELGNTNVDDSFAGGDNRSLDDFEAGEYSDDYDLVLELRGSPYLKEGLCRLKILNNDLMDESGSGSGSGGSGSGQQGSNASIISANTHSGGRFFSFFRRAAMGGGRSHSSSVSSGSGGGNGGNSDTIGTSSNPLLQKFTENFVVVSKGVLALYSFDPKIVKKQQKKTHKRRFGRHSHDEEPPIEDQNGNVGDGNWLKNAAKIGTYNLCSTFAQLEKPSNTPITTSTTSTSLKPTWSLTFPQTSKRPAKKFIFEAGTEEIALEFINTCNFWAAKITAIPTLEESMSSIEYGWNNLDMLIAYRDSFKKSKNIAKWEPLIKGIYLSNYIVTGNNEDDDVNHVGMMKQFVKSLKYYNNLRKLYKDFIQSRSRFVSNLPRSQYNCSNYNRVLQNFDRKIKDYKLELSKYKSYVIVLAFGLQLRFDLEDEDKIDDGSATVIEGHTSPASTEGATTTTTTTDSSDNHNNNNDDDDDFTKLVKLEIKKLFLNMKDVSKVIATYESCKSIAKFVSMAQKQDIERQHLQEQYLQSLNNNNENQILVKSPKTFTLSDFQGNESPIKQLLASSNNSHKGSPMGYSSIKMEEIPEEEHDEKKVETEESSSAKSSSSSTKVPDLKIETTPASALIFK